MVRKLLAIFISKLLRSVQKHKATKIISFLQKVVQVEFKFSTKTAYQKNLFN